MFELKKLHDQNSLTKKVYGDFYATTKSEVESTTDVSQIIGMPEGYSIAEGSFVYTKDFDLGIYDNGWNWGEEEDSSTRTAALMNSRPSLQTSEIQELPTESETVEEPEMR